jgi:anti-sigma factor RsiW
MATEKSPDEQPAPPPSAAPKKKHRSPAYPAIGLGQAVDRVGILYRADKQHPTSIDVVTKHWEKAGMGSAPVAVAALGYFGLLDSEGTGPGRRVHVSDLAMKILELPASSQERADGLKTAALKPGIYGELWQKYDGDLPSDDNLRSELLFERKFNQDAISPFLKAFRETVAFANLEIAGNTPDDELDVAAAQDKEEEMVPAVSRPASRRSGAIVTHADMESLEIPLGAPGRVAVLSIPRPLTEAEHKYLVGFLELSREMLLAGGRQEKDKSGEEE